MGNKSNNSDIFSLRWRLTSSLSSGTLVRSYFTPFLQALLFPSHSIYIRCPTTIEVVSRWTKIEMTILGSLERVSVMAFMLQDD